MWLNDLDQKAVQAKKKNVKNKLKKNSVVAIVNVIVCWVLPNDVTTQI